MSKIFANVEICRFSLSQWSETEYVDVWKTNKQTNKKNLSECHFLIWPLIDQKHYQISPENNQNIH